MTQEQIAATEKQTGKIQGGTLLEKHCSMPT
jgi:hypothetical protein